MRNPWLDIPPEDYLGHMSSPEVDQLSALSRLFAEALERFRPRDVLALGCSTGTGFEHINPAVTRRVTGVDIHPDYLARLAERFPDPGFELELKCADVMTCCQDADSFDLVHGALLLEYVEWPRLLPRLVPAIREGGGVSFVLQARSATAPAVTPTRFESVRGLESLFRFVDPAALVARAAAVGLVCEVDCTESLASGKSFHVLHFRKAARAKRGGP